MKYTIETRRPSDPLFSPWDIVVADTKHPGILTVQEPHPLAGDNLLGFSTKHEEVEVDVHEADWPARVEGMMPVLAGKGGIYTFTDLVTQVVDQGGE